jgi:hypothetical protein
MKPAAGDFYCSNCLEALAVEEFFSQSLCVTGDNLIKQ